MKPMPKLADYIAPQPCTTLEATEWNRDYERARADWLMENVVPLLREVRYPPDDLKSWREWRDRIDAVLREVGP